MKRFVANILQRSLSVNVKGAQEYMETSRAAVPPLEDPGAAGILIYSMVSMDLVTRGGKLSVHSCDDFGCG